jgi:hypothetical protein
LRRNEEEKIKTYRILKLTQTWYQPSVTIGSEAVKRVKDKCRHRVEAPRMHPRILLNKLEEILGIARVKEVLGVRLQWNLTLKTDLSDP